ncbi:NMT1/THI5-like protein [Elsinoe australis]|uniref:4-amino-5-hydroxymethyl-2-methylpyrimidine phosphate synthase n=1 Tax=Elsinoe australis TaxID=40998 RepID=A0A4U7B6S6_9PEZI|nr:NMT1/THI5-like protein [Elsinoe australis]
MPPKPPTPIRVALDWTPNTLHTGLYIALSKKFYSSASLSVTLTPPSPSNYITPAKQLASSSADLAICPSESCLAYAESGTLQLQAIYAICQRDASAVVSTSSDFKDLKALEGGRYGSYNARYEDAIVRTMVSGAGGKGEEMRIEGAKEKLGLWEEVKQGGVDATWVFLPWEGVEAELVGTQLNVFRPKEYGVPYGYSPVVARRRDGGLSEEALRSFVRETARGYQFAITNPEEATRIMKEVVEGRDEKFLRLSQERVNEYYGAEGAQTAFSLGKMDERKWEKWVAWLKEKGQIKADHIKLEDVFTNQYFNQCMLLEED